MHRLALAGLLLLAACDIPLVMLEIEAPSACVTQQLDIDPTNLSYAVTNLNVDGDLPSEMALNISDALGMDTPIELDDAILELPAEAEGMLDLDVRIERVSIQALAPNAAALDQVNAVALTIVPPVDSGLAEKDLVSYDRAVAGTPAGGAIEASGDEINLADYLYAGQLRFKYRLDATIDTAGEPWSVELTTCVATHGKAAATLDDIRDNL